MLTAYLTEVQRLLQNPVPVVPLYTTSDLTAYINTARSQLAGEAGCIRALGGLSTVGGTNAYSFAFITGGPTGTQGVFNIRQITLGVSGGSVFLTPRPWEWFNRYNLSQTGQANAQPNTWAQLGQGVSGNFYLSPTPDAVYTLSLDCAFYPSALATDSDPEAIPYPWTDAVPYFAAYMAYLSAQRATDAQAMYQRYQEFTHRARMISTSGVMPGQYDAAGGPPPPPPSGGA